MEYTIIINAPGTTAHYKITAHSLDGAKAEARAIARAHVMPARIEINHPDYPMLSVCADEADAPFWWVAAGHPIAASSMPAGTLKDWLA